jgi:hypothetical protein
MTGTAITPQAQAVAQTRKGIGHLLEASERPLAVLTSPHPTADWRLLCELCRPYDRLELPLNDVSDLIARLPSAEQEQDRARQIAQALQADGSRKAIVAMVAMLIDAFPSGRPANPEAYLDAIVYDLLAMRFSASVVAMACQSVRRTHKFLPSISEIIEAANTAVEEFEAAERHALRSAEMIERLRKIAAKGREEVSRHLNENAEDFSAP